MTFLGVLFCFSLTLPPTYTVTSITMMNKTKHKKAGFTTYKALLQILFLSHQLLYKICQAGIIIPLYKWRSRMSETLNISYFFWLSVQGSFHHPHIHGNSRQRSFPYAVHSSAPFCSPLPCLAMLPPYPEPRDLVHILSPPEYPFDYFTPEHSPLLILFGCMSYCRIVLYVCSESSH